MARRAVSTVNAGNPFLTLSHLEYRNEFFPPHKGRASFPRYADGIPPVPVLHRSRSPWNLFDASLILNFEYPGIIRGLMPRIRHGFLSFSKANDEIISLLRISLKRLPSLNSISFLSNNEKSSKSVLFHRRYFPYFLKLVSRLTSERIRIFTKNELLWMVGALTRAPFCPLLSP